MRFKILNSSFFFLPLFLGVWAIAGNNDVADGIGITGKWLSENKPIEMEITKSGAKYSGKIIWSSDDEIRVGHLLLKDFHYNPGENKYSGMLIRPNGGTASGEARLLDSATLKITGYKFLFSRTTTWKKSK